MNTPTTGQKLYPPISSTPYDIALEIEGKAVKITYDKKTGLLITENGKKIAGATPKEGKNTQKVSIAGHTLEVRFFEPTTSFIPGLREGFFATVDGISVQGSLSDSTEQVKNRAIALYVLGGAALFTLLYPLLTGETVPPADMMMAAVSGIGLIILGIFSGKIPRLSMGIGAMLGCLMSASYFFSMIALASESGDVQISWIWMIALGGSTIVLLQGFFLTLRMRRNSALLIP